MIRSVGGVVGRVGVDGVAPRLAARAVTLSSATAIGTDVIEVGGVCPLGVDGGVVVEGALKQQQSSSIHTIQRTSYNAKKQHLIYIKLVAISYHS